MFELNRDVPLESFASSVFDRLIYNLMRAYPKPGLITRKETEGVYFAHYTQQGSHTEVVGLYKEGLLGFLMHYKELIGFRRISDLSKHFIEYL